MIFPKFSHGLLITALWCLTSCTLGLGTIASGLINYASRPLVGQPLDYLPHPDLQQWAARPGPMLEVRTVKSIPSSLFIRDDELPEKSAHKAPRPGVGIRGKAGQFVGRLSMLLAATDSATRDLLLANVHDDEILDKVPGEYDDKRRQLALSEFPFVLLQGENLLYLSKINEPWPEIARADKHGKVTIITKDGTFFGIARRIHFRSSSSEVILEGDPTVQSGQQHIKGVRPDTIMRLDFAKRIVTVDGTVVVKKLFR